MMMSMAFYEADTEQYWFINNTQHNLLTRVPGRDGLERPHTTTSADLQSTSVIRLIGDNKPLIEFYAASLVEEEDYVKSFIEQEL